MTTTKKPSSIEKLYSFERSERIIGYGTVIVAVSKLLRKTKEGAN
ncbi:MAG: hypothetical protein ABSA33_02060 [Candidatus Micrarchaeaceae archaeon]